MSCTQTIRTSGQPVPTYRGELPEGHDGSGLRHAGRDWR